MPAVERSRVSDPSSIPRPPNSWILYRSDMVTLIAPPAPGTTRSQAEVSRIISSMWKKEKPEVKAEYERRAEVKKLEHAAMYPNYRYMPKSKELKEELKKAKEEQKRKKNKRNSDASEASRSRAGRDPPFTSHGYPFLPVDSSQYVHGGPSPPMSAASSPSSEPCQLPQPIASQNERVTEPVAYSQAAKSYYRPHATVSQPVQQHPAPQDLIDSAALQPPTTSHYQTPPADSPAQQNELYFPPQLLQPPLSQSEQNTHEQYALLQNDYIAPTQHEDYLSFNLQQFAADFLGQWTLQNPEFQPTLDHFLNDTSGDCYQLQINPLDQGNFDQTPVGPLEIEVGQIDYDYSQLQWNSNAMEAFQPLFNNVTTENVGYENTTGPSLQTSPSEGSDIPSAGLDQMDQYINFNPTFDFAGHSPAVEEVAVAPPRAPYIPPAGAAHAGRRRVAGSWNASIAMQDPIDV
ncbi:hypothetical protein C0995_016013 [Termitomyces sp. Mi166|nr:hypothetical protein C0995_016013 [Termitomyces sp. Mi166\